MKKRSVKIPTLIVFFSLIDVGLQFGSYYFLNKLYPAFILIVVLNLVLCHIYLESSLSYSALFLHSALTALLSTGCTAFIYYKQTGNLLVFSKYLVLLVLLNWAVPLAYSIFRDITDHGPRFVGFRSYFIKTSILFALYYIPVFAICFFISPAGFPATASSINNPYIPFLATATYIEDVIYMGMSIKPFVYFTGISAVLFIPAGFYGSILLKKASRPVFVLLTLILPLLTEGIPFFYGHAFYIDGFLFKFVGILFGIIFYKILNSITNASLQCDFLTERNNYTFFNMYY